MEINDTSVVAIRSSGRVRRRPEHYSDNYSPQHEENGKRKRTSIQQTRLDNGDDGIDGSENESEGETDGEPDEEELREHKRTQRKIRATTVKPPSAKKLKIDALPIRSLQKAPRSKPLKKIALPAFAIETAISEPFRSIFTGKSGPEEIAAQWIKDFEKDQPLALAAIINLMLGCSGCRGTVDQHDILDTDAVTTKLDDLRDEHQASNPTDYPLIAKTKSASVIKHGLCDFLQALIKTIAANNVLYREPSLIENLHNWLSTMSSAPNRPFRHTATVASLSVVSALCEVARENADELAKDRRHAESEKGKARPNKARVKQLEEKFKARSDVQTVLETLLKDWFDTVFIHRYRDVDPLVRRDCMSALGDWVSVLPDVFLNGSHLRYFGWVLGDPNPSTRGEVVRQLLRLYREKSMLGGLKTFTEKFRSRLVEIATTDADTSIRINGIQLLEHLRDSGLLEPNDIDDVGKLIFDADLRIRKAVSTFFADNVQDLYNAKIDELGGMDVFSENMAEDDAERYDQPKAEWLVFKSLAEMLRSYDIEMDDHKNAARLRGDGRLILHLGNTSSRFVLAADAVYEKIDGIQNWQIMAAYLLYDHSLEEMQQFSDEFLSMLKQQAALDSAEESILLEVLTASVKWQLTELDTSIHSPKKPLSKRERQQLQGEQESAARHLVDLIPKLLKKFGDAPSTAAAVLRLEALLSLPSLTTFRQDSLACASLLDDIKRQFMAHTTDDVLAPASAAILHAKSYGELDDLTEEKIVELWDDVSANFLELITPDVLDPRRTSSIESMGALNNNLLRLTRLAAISDCTDILDGENAIPKGKRSHNQNSAIDCLIALINRASVPFCNGDSITGQKLSDEIAARAAEVALFYFRWHIKSIASRVSEAHGNDVSFEELERLALRRDTFVENLKGAIINRRPVEDVSCRLAGITIELHSSMAVLRHVEPRLGVSDDYIVLVLDCDEDLQAAVMKVFEAAEKDFARCSGRHLPDATETLREQADLQDIDDDPLSDSDEDGADETAPKDSRQKRTEEKMLRAMLAEQKLCSITGKIIQAVFANVMDRKLVKLRLERNKTRLGSNFKECVSYLSAGEPKKAKPRSGAKANSTSKASTMTNHKTDGVNVIDDADEQSVRSEDDDELEDAAADERENSVEKDPRQINGENVQHSEEDEASLLGD